MSKMYTAKVNSRKLRGGTFYRFEVIKNANGSLVTWGTWFPKQNGYQQAQEEGKRWLKNVIPIVNDDL